MYNFQTKRNYFVNTTERLSIYHKNQFFYFQFHKLKNFTTCKVKNVKVLTF